jgi:endonuclease/exonuclease/phosphatase family metal-dependent hydrolase
MRFLLYNVRYCSGHGGKYHLPWSGYLRRTDKHLDRITAFIQTIAPDIAGLLEVDAGSYRSRRRNQAAMIAKTLGHYHVYCSKYPDRSLARRLPIMDKQVNAFLCRDPIHARRFHFFKKGVKRLVIELELKNLVVFLVHLSLGFRTRHDQLNDLYALVQSNKKPCIVAGDFNAFRGDREITLFMAATGLVSACVTPRPSFPSWKPRRQLDFILHNSAIRITNFFMPNVTFSDHLPLVCDFEIQGASAQNENAKHHAHV